MMSRTEIQAETEALCNSIRERVLRQYDYSVEMNVPTGRLSPDEVGSNAMRSGVVAALTEFSSWDVGEVTELCADLMEDVNDSKTAAYLRGLE